MDLKEENVLLFTRFMGQGGTENVLLQICEALQGYVNKIVVCSAGGVNVEKLDSLGIKHYIIPDIQSKSLKNVLEISRLVRTIVTKEHINVIHTHHRMAAFYVEILGLYKRATCINTCHNTFGDKVSLTRFSYRHTKLIACGQAVKLNLEQRYGFSSRRITVIRNTVRPSERKSLTNEKLFKLKSDGFLVIGNVGRLSEQKGMKYFLDAINLITKNTHNLRFVIVGDGELRQSLQEQAKALNIERYVTFLGYQKNIQGLMSQMDVVVLSSLWEGMPLTPVEAFSVGTPVIATDVPGSLEIVEDKTNGLVVPTANSNELANAIMHITAVPSLLQQLSEGASQTYAEKFNYKTFLKKYRDVYSNA